VREYKITDWKFTGTIPRATDKGSQLEGVETSRVNTLYHQRAEQLMFYAWLSIKGQYTSENVVLEDVYVHHRIKNGHHVETVEYDSTIVEQLVKLGAEEIVARVAAKEFWYKTVQQLTPLLSFMRALFTEITT